MNCAHCVQRTIHFVHYSSFLRCRVPGDLPDIAAAAGRGTSGGLAIPDLPSARRFGDEGREIVRCAQKPTACGGPLHPTHFKRGS